MKKTLLIELLIVWVAFIIIPFFRPAENKSASLINWNKGAMAQMEANYPGLDTLFSEKE